MIGSYSSIGNTLALHPYTVLLYKNSNGLWSIVASSDFIVLPGHSVIKKGSLDQSIGTFRDLQPLALMCGIALLLTLAVVLPTPHDNSGTFQGYSARCIASRTVFKGA